ncbi:hypothetical protein L596_029554 [Steinernema carpocapsae]|uniref:Protein kinase domain-containing protein n=1 Tax=Steinernema carpocapsae TaxID=34508 RepID=A0A4U5LUZ5_STECR|nr:hypothetical protein L596_029554 [Steinernema carpocapsae]
MMQTITNPPQNHVNPLFDDAGYIRIDSGLGRIHPDEEFVLHRNRYSRDYSPEAEEAREIGERLRLEVCHPLQQDFKTLKELADRKKKCFALGPKLGEGQFSKVYIGMFQGKKMAVKAISMADVGRDYLEHFLPREIDCWQRMEHPNPPRLFGMIQGRNTVIMYSELAPHGDLLRVVQIMGRVGYVRTTFWMSQILRALDYLHTHGIAHRDLKLENCI